MMINVEAEILAALMGFGGTLVGAGVSMWATVLTQRHQTKTGRADRVEQLGRAAGEKALAELYALRRHLGECKADSIPEDHQPWRKIAKDHMDEAELAVGLIPQGDQVRERLEEVLTATYYGMTQREQSLIRQLGSTRSGASEAIGLLSSFLRGDPLPERSPGVERFREQRAVGTTIHELENPPDAP